MSSRHRRLRSIAVGILAVAALAGMPGSALGATSISLQPVVGGFASPTQVTNAHDGTNRLFVVEQRGTIRVVQNGVLQPGYFLDIRSEGRRRRRARPAGPRVRPEASRPTTGSTSTTRATAATSSCRASRPTRPGRRRRRATARPLRPDRAQRPGEPQRRRRWHSARTATCTSASATAAARATRPTTARTRTPSSARSCGSTSTAPDRHVRPLLRAGAATRSPGRRPGLGEIWDYGAAEPVADLVRPGDRRAVRSATSARTATRRSTARRPAPRAAGTTAGTRWRASTATPPPSARCAGDTLPNAEYSHAGGNCSVTGGYVYRGPTQTALVGLYVFADYCSGRIWTLPDNGDAGQRARDVARGHGSQHHVVRRERERRAVPRERRRRGVPGPRLLTRARALSSTGWAPAWPRRSRRRCAAARRGEDRLDLGGRTGLVERRTDDRPSMTPFGSMNTWVGRPYALYAWKILPEPSKPMV